MSNTGKHIGAYAGKVIGFYADGFRSMTVGRKLWVIIILKVIVLFAVLRLFFFPDVLAEDYDNDAQRSDAVRSVMTSRRM